MNYDIKTNRPGRIRVTLYGGILAERDERRLVRLISQIPGVTCVTPYPRLGELGVSYREAPEAPSCREEVLHAIASFTPRSALRPPRKRPKPHLIKDPALRIAADTALGIIAPAPVRIVGKLIDSGYRAHLQ